MQYVIIALLWFLIAPGIVRADAKEIIAWWQKNEPAAQVADSLKPYAMHASVKFNHLEDYKGRAIKIPDAIIKKVETIRLLYAQKDATFLLATPENKLKKIKTIDDQYYAQMQKCADDKSWIIVKSKNTWSELALNPYCTTAYGEDEISFDMYWVRGVTLPYIDIVTNGAACVPHQLYEGDPKTGVYRPVAEKCVQ